jgi:hypothetical protein
MRKRFNINEINQIVLSAYVYKKVNKTIFSDVRSNNLSFSIVIKFIEHEYAININ